MYYYRLLVEFSHDLQRPEFEEFMEQAIERFMESLGVESTEFINDVRIIGDDVTEEYDLVNGVAELREEMEAPNAVDEFIRGTHFRDYPPPGPPSS